MGKSGSEKLKGTLKAEAGAGEGEGAGAAEGAGAGAAEHRQQCHISCKSLQPMGFKTCWISQISFSAMIK